MTELGSGSLPSSLLLLRDSCCGAGAGAMGACSGETVAGASAMDASICGEEAASAVGMEFTVGVTSSDAIIGTMDGVECCCVAAVFAVSISLCCAAWF